MLKWGLTAFRHGGVIRDVAFFLQFFDVLVNAQFGDGADSGGTDLERHPFVCFRDEKLFGLEVWVEAAARLVVGVGDVVARNWLLARQVANS